MNKNTKTSNKLIGRYTVIVVVITFVLLFALIALLINSKLNKIIYDDGIRETADIENVVDKDYEDDFNALEESDEFENLEEWSKPILSNLGIKSDDSILNILLLGTDEREYDFDDSARADAVMILSINFHDNSAKLISLERGMGMPITDGVMEGKYDFITHIFRWGGADMVLQDVRDCLKIDVNHYVRVNLNAFIKVVDVVGGVDIELTEREAWYLNTVQAGKSTGPYLNQGYYRGDAGSEEHEFVEGSNHLSGVMALAYSRLRGIDSDWHRVERQRTVIQAIVTSLKNANISTLNNLCDEIFPLVMTNFTKDELIALATKMPAFMGVTLDQLTIPEQGNFGYMMGIDDRSVIAVDYDATAKMLHEFIYGNIEE